MYGIDTRWPAERDERLRALVEARLSAGQAARRMKRTRGSVIGRAWRLGLRFNSWIRRRKQP